MKNNFLTRFLRGLSLGMGAIPGVSAGTMGVIFKIYDELIGGISGLTKDFKKNIKILIPIVLGAGISAIIFFVGAHFGYDLAPFAITSLFAGFTIGSLPVVFPEFQGKKLTTKDIILMLVGFILSAGIGALSVLALTIWKIDLSSAFVDRVWWIYPVCAIVGFVAAYCCIIPGISGAMILFIFGLYNPVIALYVGNQSIFHVPGTALTGLLLTLCILIGALLGLFVIGKNMNFLLTKHRSITFKLISGFIIGSVVAMFINNQIWYHYTGFDDGNIVIAKTQLWEYILGIVLFITAGVSMAILTIKANKRKQENLIDENSNN